MSELYEVIDNKKGLIPGKAVMKEKIMQAEQTLGLSFSPEYCSYLLRYGEISYYRHELTGITESTRLHVVNVTFEEWELNNLIPHDMYVIEQTNVDGIVIWQNRSGKIFKSIPFGEPVLLCDSLADYISKY